MTTQTAGGGTHLGGALPPPAQTPGSTSPLPGRPTSGEGVVPVGPAGEGGSPPPSPTRRVMTVRPTVADRPQGAWAARCRLCPDWTPDVYRNDHGARQAAAHHLWKRHVRPQPPALCPVSGKRKHLTKAEAWEHIRSLYRSGKGNPDYSAYWCRDCHGWHVGHSKVQLAKRIKRAIRR